MSVKLRTHSIVPQESTANSNLGCGTIITSGTIAGIRDFWLRYFYYQRYFYLRLESSDFVDITSRVSQSIIMPACTIPILPDLTLG